MTPKQEKYIKAILAKEGVSCMEENYAITYSNKRTNKLAELTHKETQELFNDILGKSSKDKMKGKIISMAHEMRWKLPNGKIDIARLNAWCNKSTPFHKDFDKLTTKELTKTVGVFEKVYKSFLKAL